MSRLRLRVLALLLYLVWVGVAVRTFEIMIIRSERYRAMASPYVSQQPLLGERGAVVDRRGRVWASDREVYTVTADPYNVLRPVETARVLASLLGGSPKVYLARLQQRLRPEVLLFEDPSPAEVRALAPLLARKWVVIRARSVQTRHQLVVHPAQVQDEAAVAAYLAPILKTSPANALARLQTSVPSVSLGEIPPAQADELNSLALAGLEVVQTTREVGRQVYLRPGAPGAVEYVDTDRRQYRLNPELATVLEELASQRSCLRVEDWPARLRNRHVELASNVPVEKARDLEELKSPDGPAEVRTALQGVYPVQSRVRYHPHGEVGTAWLGRVDPVGNQAVSGWEKVFEPILSSQTGALVRVVDVKGRTIPQFGVWRHPSQPGSRVQLTLDLYLQSEAEALLREAVQANQANWGGLMVVDPYQGAVLAMAAVTGQADPNEHLGATRPVTQAFEPGSILKSLVVAAALQEGVITPDTPFWCGGRYHLKGDQYLHCVAWDRRRGHGQLTVTQAIRSSCNVVLMQIGARLGAQRLDQWFRRFGLYDKTNIWDPSLEAIGYVYADLPGSEPPGWSLSKRATVTYGHGISVTMAGIVRAYCALINGGRLPRLHVFQNTLAPDGHVLNSFPVLGEQPILSPAVSRAMKAMMAQVVEDERGTAPAARSPLYPIAGKTGTALHYRSSGRTVSFAGFAPWHQPRLLALAVLDLHGGSAAGGGRLCAPLVKTMLERSLAYLGFPCSDNLSDAQLTAYLQGTPPDRPEEE